MSSSARAALRVVYIHLSCLFSPLLPFFAWVSQWSLIAVPTLLALVSLGEHFTCQLWMPITPWTLVLLLYYFNHACQGLSCILALWPFFTLFRTLTRLPLVSANWNSVYRYAASSTEILSLSLPLSLLLYLTHSSSHYHLTLSRYVNCSEWMSMVVKTFQFNLPHH